MTTRNDQARERHTSLLLNTEEAVEVQRGAHAKGDLLIWTVYCKPSDQPDHYIARPHSSRFARPLPYHLRAESLEGIRELLPSGLYRMARAEADDPVIVETWI